MIIAGTGHRPNKLGGYREAAHERLVGVATAALERLRPRMVISGMALGWDTALAKAAINADIPLIAAVPFDGQDALWPSDARRRYLALLVGAQGIVYVCSPGYHPQKMQIRNEWMVDQADEILALWDGSSGGTANCVAYAQKKGKKIHNVWKEWVDSDL